MLTRLIISWMESMHIHLACIHISCILETRQKKNEFCGYIRYRPSRDLTRPLGLPRGLKGLLHMPNATVITYGSGI